MFARATALFNDSKPVAVVASDLPQRRPHGEFAGAARVWLGGQRSAAQIGCGQRIKVRVHFAAEPYRVLWLVSLNIK